MIVGVLACSACGDNRDTYSTADACTTLWYADSDGDGFGDPDVARLSCDAPDGFIADNTDCDDHAATAHPGGTEVCGNGIDDDCAGDDEPLCSSERDGWTITAGPIERADGWKMITATVTFTKISGTATTRGGGACLLADLVDQGVGAVTCTTDSDCIAAGQAAFGASAWGYCTAPDGSGEAKRCWTRPGDFCVRSQANMEGAKILAPVMWDARRTNERVRWLLLACMAEEATPGGCGPTGTPAQYVRSIGPATSFP